MVENDIPIIDLGSDNETDIEKLKVIGGHLVEALETVGFLYVTNHCIPIKLIDTCFVNWTLFFALPEDVKMNYYRDAFSPPGCDYLPYNNPEAVVEKFDKTLPPDAKETMTFCHKCPTSEKWPRHETLPNDFESTSRQLIAQSQDLNLRLMLLLGYGLGLDDPCTFIKGFSGHNTPANSSKFRVAYYPAMKEGCLQPGQLRCGEHTDYGTFTLLFLDSTPGLQVYNRKGFYQDIKHVPGAILINIGDLLQRWSGDKLHAAKHRVIVRPDTLTRPRYSLIYFTSPDDQFHIVPITDDLECYKPITAGEHLKRRYDDAFIRGKGVDYELNTFK